jgi:hypothetical protein
MTLMQPVLVLGVQTRRARLQWFRLEEDDHCPQLPDEQGLPHSRVFPGLQLPVAPLLDGDTAKVLATLTGPEPLTTSHRASSAGRL